MGPALSLHPIIICAPRNSVLPCFSSHLLLSSSSHTHEIQTQMATGLLAFSYGMPQGSVRPLFTVSVTSGKLLMLSELLFSFLQNGHPNICFTQFF